MIYIVFSYRAAADGSSFRQVTVEHFQFQFAPHSFYHRVRFLLAVQEFLIGAGELEEYSIVGPKFTRLCWVFIYAVASSAHFPYAHVQ